MESELTESQAFIGSFVQESVVSTDGSVRLYSMPMPDDSRIPGKDAEEGASHGLVLSIVKGGGPGWVRTSDLPVMSRLLFH